MTASPKQGIYKKWTLNDAELAEIQQLARICQEHAPLDLRLNWDGLAMRIGDRATRRQYALFAALAYLAPVAMLASGLAGAWVLLPLLTIPLAYRAVRSVLGGLSGRALNPLLAESGRLQLLYGLLLAVGLVLG